MYTYAHTHTHTHTHTHIHTCTHIYVYIYTHIHTQTHTHTHTHTHAYVNSNALIAGSKDGTVWMWLSHNGQCVQVFAGHDGGVTCGKPCIISRLSFMFMF